MKRILLSILTALALVTSLPASVGTHPLSGGDAGTGQDAPQDPDDALAIEEGYYEGDLLAPIDTADWYLFEVEGDRRLAFDSGSDFGVKVVVIPPDGNETLTHSYASDNTTGTYRFGFLSGSLLPAHYGFLIKTGPVDTSSGGCHGHCHPAEEPQPLSDDGASGNITQEDPIDTYLLDADAYEIVTLSLATSHDADISVSVRSLDHHHGHHHDHNKTQFEDHIPRPYEETLYQEPGSTSAQWFQPYATTLLVTVQLSHRVYKYCDPTGCYEEHETGHGGSYTLSVYRETDVPLPDLAVTGIEEVRRPIQTDLTPDVPNVVNERRTIVVDVANLGEGTARWGGYAFIEIIDDRGPFYDFQGDFAYIEPLEAGGTTTIKVDWDTTDDIGDHTIRVYLFGIPEWFDADHRNNEAEHETYVKIGGVL